MKTVILGASTNPSRYSNRVTLMMLDQGIEVIPVGIKKGEIGGVTILDIRQEPVIENVHTITLYMSAQNQQPWHHYILKLNPQRIIFNPGAENDKLTQLAIAKGILVEDSCTLVMLTVNTF